MIQHPINTIITDIEGTTTDIDFVHKVLFPYARARLPDFVRNHANNPEVRQQLLATAELAELPEADDATLVQTLLSWIDADRKATPLKALQGLIWRRGYEASDFRGHLYPDVAPELKRWKDAGIALHVYSSGSIKAQRLLFGYSDAGDLTPLFDGYFDTTTGQKRDADSYRTIASALKQDARHCLFLSDVLAELDAARQAGMQTAHLVRSPDMDRGHHPAFNDFCQISQQLFAATSSEASS
ncbi:MAG: acireductone synthase [Saccharospirillum sp.]|nr:acireductone synthase [Saccharospirillum sp.]